MQMLDGHFVARIEFLPEIRPKAQGYRPDLFYLDDPGHGWMIWPRFIDDSGNELPESAPVPKVCNAQMFIVNDELRKSLHRHKICPWLEFRLREGHRLVANGVVLAVAKSLTGEG